MLHDFISIVLEYYSDDWKQIFPRDNATPHILLLRLFDEYNEKNYGYITKQSPFHKLSYKFTDEQLNKNGTYYKYLFEKQK